MPRRTLPGLMVVLALVGCDSTAPDGTSRLSILLTDADGDVEQAVVKIERVELVGGAGGPLVLDDGGWMGDLTDLTNDFVTLVDETVVPQGGYSQLRVVVSEACIGVDAGEDPDQVYVSPGATSVTCVGDAAGSLQMPSFAQTGIKVIFQGPIEVTSDQKIVFIDFDVAQSFGKKAGNSGQWVMDPTILGIDLTFSATVNVTVELASGILLPSGITFEDFTASLDGEDQALAADGTASFLFVVPGAYPLDLEPPTGVTITTTPELLLDLTVDPQEVEDVAITIESLTGP
jgi:hypothetical protein